MTLQEMIDEEKKEGYEEGRAEGEAAMKQSILEKMRASGMSEEQIAKIIN